MANPARFRHRVTIERRQEVLDDIGGINQDEMWHRVFDAWAYIKPIRGREYFTAGAMNSELTHEVCFRWRKDQTLTSDMRVRLDRRIFEIEAVINVEERDREWELKCRERSQSELQA